MHHEPPRLPIFGKDSKTVPASYNTKWRISLGADLIALDERYSDGLVLIDYGGGKASGSATVFKANADDGGKGAWRPWVYYRSPGTAR